MARGTKSVPRSHFITNEKNNNLQKFVDLVKCIYPETIALRKMSVPRTIV